MADDILVAQFETTNLGSRGFEAWLKTQQAAGFVHLLGTAFYKTRENYSYLVAAVGKNTTRSIGALGTFAPVGQKNVLPNGVAGLQMWMNAQLAGTAAPDAPTLSLTAAGSLTGQGTLYAKVTLVTPLGETKASTEANLAVTDDHELTVASPAAGSTGATGWNVYIGTSAGEEKLQNSDPIAIGTNYTLTAAPSTSGATAPTTDGTAAKSVNSFDAILHPDSHVSIVCVMSN